MKKFKFKFNKVSIIVLAIMVIVSLIGLDTALAATSPSLGAADDYGILSSSYINTSASTTITGAVGFTTGPAVAPLGTHLYYGSGAPYSTAGTDQGIALPLLNNQSCTTITGPLNATEIETAVPGVFNDPGVFPPGCYTMAGDLIITLSTSITLDLTASGGTGSTWIFKSTGGGLTTGADSFVTLAHGASACDVFWVPVAAANIGAYTGDLPNTTKLFIGTIIDAAGITVGDNVAWTGRALAFGGTVTTGTNVTINNSCAAVPATLNVIKVVVNNSGRNNVIADFPLFVDGSLTTSGADNILVAGTHTVTETYNSSEYTQTFSSSCPLGVITLDAGETGTCTITNDDIAPVSHSSSSIIYGCKDPTATNYNAFSASNPALCAYATIHIISTPVIPKLPKTGFPPQEKSNLWNIVIGAGVLMLVSTSLVLALRKSKI